MQPLPFHGSSQFGLFDFQLWQQIHKPFERLLIAINPEEVHFSQVHNTLRYLTGPFKVAAWACVPCLPVSMHDRLQYGCKRCDADARCYQNRMLRPEYVTGRSSIWAIDVNLLIDRSINVLYWMQIAASDRCWLRLCPIVENFDPKYPDDQPISINESPRGKRMLFPTKNTELMSFRRVDSRQ